MASYSEMGPSDFRRESLLRRTKANLIDLLLAAKSAESEELVKLREENAKLQQTLQDREEASNFPVEPLDASDERTITALNVAMMRNRDFVIADLNACIAHQQTRIHNLKQGGGLIRDVLLKDFNAVAYPHMARVISANTMTVSQYVRKLENDLEVFKRTLMGY
jgi:hypothetical protein